MIDGKPKVLQYTVIDGKPKVLQYTVIKGKPKVLQYRCYKYFDNSSFQDELKARLSITREKRGFLLPEKSEAGSLKKHI